MLGSVDQPMTKGPVPNYMVHSLLVTVLCCPCMPLGIAAFAHATKVNINLSKGDHAAAVVASENAKKWCIWAFVFGLMGYLILFTLGVWSETL